MTRAGGLALALSVWATLALSLAAGCRASDSGAGDAPPPVEARAPALELVVDASRLPAPERACLAELAEVGALLPRDPTAPRGAWTNQVVLGLGRAQAAVAASEPRLADYLARTVLALTPGTLVGLEAARQAANDSHLIVLFGPATPGVVPIKSLEVGLAATEDQAWLDDWRERLPEFLAWLDVGMSTAPGADVPPELDLRSEIPGEWRIADLCLREGTRARSSSGSTALPIDPSYEATLGSGRVFWRNVILERWHPQEVAPTAEVTLARGQVGFATPRALLGFYALRFPSSRITRSVVLGPDGPVRAREYFGADWAALAIARSDLLGTLALDWCARAGVLPPELRREALATLVVLAFRATDDVRRGTAPSAHAQASAAILNALVASSALVPRAGDTWELDFVAAENEVRALAQRVLRIWVEGDRAGARAFAASGARFAPGLQRTLGGIARLRLTIATPSLRPTAL